MSDPAPPPGFTEDLSHTLPDAPAATPSAAPSDKGRTEFFRSTIEHMLNSGHATRADLDAFAQQQGVDPAQLNGFTPEVFAQVAAGQRVPVGLHGAAQASAPPAGFTEEVPLPAAEPKERSTMDTINMGLADVQRGLNAPLDMLAAVPNALINAVTGADMSTSPLNDQVDQQVAAYEAHGHDLTPHSDGEKLISAGIKGAAPALVLGPAGMAPMAVEAAAGGFGSMASEGTRQAGGGPLAQLAAGLVGGIGGAGGAAATGRVARGFGERAPNAFLQAAHRAGVADEILPADAGGPITRSLTAGTAQTPFGNGPIVNQAARLNEKAASVIADHANSFAKPQSGETLGDTFRSGLEKVIKSTRTSASRVYDRAAQEAENATVDLKSARDVVDGHIARLEATAQTGSIPAQLADLKGLRSELDRPLTVQGVRDMRTEMFVAPELRGTPAEARLKQITNAAADDVVASLRAQGKEDAARSFQQADAMWAERLDLIDKVIKPILGPNRAPKSGEAIAKSIDASLKGNNARYAKFINALPAEEQEIARASVISPLGRDKDGAFSISRFADDWNAIGGTAKKALFGNDLTESLDALATVGKQAKMAMRYANHSNTARGLETGRLLTYITALPTMGATIGGQIGMGRLLASPRFARWLASSAKKPNAAAQVAHVNRLTAIAAGQPAIANDVLRLQDYLSKAIAQSPGRLAADEGKPDHYHEWLSKYGIREDPAYDTRAAFNAGLKPDSRGHLNDTYKLPNHPTFSNESIHNGEQGKAGGEWIQTGGKAQGFPEGQWSFKASDWNLRNMSKPALKHYFDTTEPGMTIIFPDGEKYVGGSHSQPGKKPSDSRREPPANNNTNPQLHGVAQ